MGIIKEIEVSREEVPRKKITRKNPKEPAAVCSDYETRNMDVSIPKLKIGYKIDKSYFKGYSDLELKIYLDAILTSKFSELSDLYEKLVEENLALYGIYPVREVRGDYVLLTFEAETEYKEEVIDLIRNELKNIKITKEELERVKRTNIASFILHFNDIMDVAQDIEDDVLTNGKIEEDIIPIYKSMDLKMANDIASKIRVGNESVFFIDKLAN